jgi:hypothetical protein
MNPEKKKKHERKYVPVDPKAVSPTCHKAYVNVYAISQDDVDAVICCDGSHDKWAWLTGTYAGALCVPIVGSIIVYAIGHHGIQIKIIESHQYSFALLLSWCAYSPNCYPLQDD